MPASSHCEVRYEYLSRRLKALQCNIIAAVSTVSLSIVLTGCSKSVVGEYACTGLGIDTMSLKSDGTYSTKFDMFGHAEIGTGRYTVHGDTVKMVGTTTVEGLSEINKDDMDFKRIGNNELKFDVVNDCKRK